MLARLSPLIALAAAGALGVSIAGAQPANPQGSARQCFTIRNWEGWKASPDSKILYLRTGLNQVFRLDLSNACTELQDPYARIVNRVEGGSDFVCSPLDLDLTVHSTPGVSTPCLVSAITPMTRAEIDALPRKLRP